MATWKEGPEAVMRATTPSLGQRFMALEQRWREGLVLLLLGGALALYYFSDSLPLTLVGALAFVALAWWRLELGLVWALFVVPFYRYPKAFEPTILGLVGIERLQPLEFSLFEFAVLACGLAWLVRQVAPRGVEERWRLGVSRHARLHPALALLVVASLSLLTSQYLRFSLREYRIVILEPLLFYFLLRRAVSSKEGVGRFLAALVLLGVAVSLASLYHYFFVGMVEATGGVRRLLAIYHSPNALGLFLGRIAPLAVALALVGVRDRRERWLYGLATLVILASLGLTFSRGAWLGVGAALVFLAVARFGWRGVGGVLGVGVVALFVLALLPQGRLLSEASNLQRWYIWQSALAMIRDHPLLGLGLDNFLYHYPNYMLAEAWAEPDISHPHNFILDFWTRLGILGVVVALWLQLRFWRLGVSLWQQGREGISGALALALMASMVDFLVHGLIDNSFFLVDLAVVFWLSFGLMETLGRDHAQRAMEVAG